MTAARALLPLLTVACATACSLTGCPPGAPDGDGPTVDVYTSVDEPYSRQMEAAFEAVDGNPDVALLTDSELEKTVGLANKLLAEADNPRADVWWASEPSQTIRLVKEGVLAPYESPEAAARPEQFRDPDHRWTMLAVRLRVLVRHRDGPGWPDGVPFDLRHLPDALAALQDQVPEGGTALAMADPTAGTTATHAAALFQCYGADDAKAWHRALRDRGVIPRGGNAQVVDAVATGTAMWGITDTDDVYAAQAQDKPVEMIAVPGTLAIPNTIAIVANCRDRAAAERFVDFVLSQRGEQLMANVAAKHLPTRGDVDPPAGFPPLSELHPLPVNWPSIDPHREAAMRFVRQLWPAD